MSESNRQQITEIDLFTRTRNVSIGKEIKENRGVGEGTIKHHGGLTAQQVLEAIPIPLLLQTEAFITAWADWIEFRLECGRMYRWATTIRCFRQTIRKIEKFGHDGAIAAIDQSIELGYRGVFPPRNFDKPSQSKTVFGRGACSERGIQL